MEPLLIRANQSYLLDVLSGKLMGLYGMIPGLRLTYDVHVIFFLGTVGRGGSGLPPVRKSHLLLIHFRFMFKPCGMKLKGLTANL